MTASNTFDLTIRSIPDGTQRTITSGVAVVPSISPFNSYGNWFEILTGAQVTDDAYEIEIIGHTANASGEVAHILMEIGADAAGGSNYTAIISDLIFSGAMTQVLGEIRYKFRLFIAAGSSIAARLAKGQSPGRQVYTAINLSCQPTRPDIIRCGTYVRTFGSDTSVSDGTTVTPGTAAEGAWTQLGGAIADADLWEWHVAMGVAGSIMESAVVTLDLDVSDGVTENVVVAEQFLRTSANEQCEADYRGAAYAASVGQVVRGRAQTSGSITNQHAMAAYATGGDAPGTGGQLTVGGETTPPVLGAVTPDQEEEPGSAGAFSATYATAKDTPITLRLADVASDIAFVTIWVKFETADESFVIYAGRPVTDGNAGFVAPFNTYSTIDASDPADVALSIRHNDGWPGNGAAQHEIVINYKAVDTAGNVLA